MVTPPGFGVPTSDCSSACVLVLVSLSSSMLDRDVAQMLCRMLLSGGQALRLKETLPSSAGLFSGDPALSPETLLFTSAAGVGVSSEDAPPPGLADGVGVGGEIPMLLLAAEVSVWVCLFPRWNGELRKSRLQRLRLRRSTFHRTAP